MASSEGLAWGILVKLGLGVVLLYFSTGFDTLFKMSLVLFVLAIGATVLMAKHQVIEFIERTMKPQSRSGASS